MTTRRIGPSMTIALSYIASHTGCCAADVDRACRTARGGHRWMYATVQRLARAGLIVRTRAGNKILLRATAACDRV